MFPICNLKYYLKLKKHTTSSYFNKLVIARLYIFEAALEILLY